MKKHKFCLKFTTGLPSAKIRDFGTSFVPKSVRSLVENLLRTWRELGENLLRTWRELGENLERTWRGREITKIIEILTLREQWSQICRNFFFKKLQFLKMIGFTQWCDVFSKQCEIARFTQWCEMFCLIRPRVKNCPFYPMVRRFFQ